MSFFNEPDSEYEITFILPKPNQSPYVCPQCGSEIAVAHGVTGLCTRGHDVRPVFGNLTHEWRQVKDALDQLDDIEMADVVQVEEDWKHDLNAAIILWRSGFIGFGARCY